MRTFITPLALVLGLCSHLQAVNLVLEKEPVDQAAQPARQFEQKIAGFIMSE